ncbi:MAG: SWIM zinc finger family protein [Armatimonadota bacterium]
MNATTTATRTEYLTAAQKSLQTTISRGETLFADGYSIEPYANRPGVYSVARAENDSRPVQAGDTLWNDVDVANQDCTCKAFEFHGTCKHLIATNKVVANAARLMAPFMPVISLSSQDKPMQRGFASVEAFEKQRDADFG